MALEIAMKDSLIHEIVDEDFISAYNSLNMAGMKGMGFVQMDLRDGSKIMLNIENILTVKEHDD